MRYGKIFIYYFLILQLVLGTWFQSQVVSADTSPSASPAVTRIFEVTDSGSSDLQSSLGNNSKYLITTYSMKKFVALREELDGKYDVIYIGTSSRSPKYSTATASPYTDQNKAHDTSLKMNDITNLKADEIITSFINKGQLVIFEDDIYSQTNGNLYKKFSGYRNNVKDNVKVVSKVDDAVTYIKNSAAYTSKRPQFTLTSSPTPYLVNGVVNTAAPYKAGDVITFQYEINNYSSFAANRLTANLYFDTDYNHSFEAVEVMSSSSITNSTGTVTYVLPPGFSGLRYWKFEVVDTTTGLKDTDIGTLRIRDQKVAVKVLQIMKPGVSSRLDNDSKIMKQTYLHSDDYDISIDIIDMNTFNSTTYSTINGKYDMLIFGFADSYNTTGISDSAAKAVDQFIATGQSVMFTHDTIFQSGNNWVKYFMNDTGQISTEKHDLGYGAPQTSNNTIKVNEGLMTQFPFQLGTNIKIATTHDQYYRLDLEDKSIIPWYNITGGPRDTNDSWYHYYTYSKGNVTYSGTGHTSNEFPMEEQQLFVNTMYRAFIGSNHSPVVTVYTPSETVKVKQGQALDVVYQIQDLDLKDNALKTKIYVNNVEKYSNTNAHNGDIIQQSIAKVTQTAGPVTVRIEVEDNKGAKAIKEIKVVVYTPSNTNLQLTRTITPDSGIVAPNTPATLTYTITPQAFAASDISKMTGLRPFSLAEADYSIGQKITLLDSKSYGNFGAVAFDKNGASQFRADIASGNQEPVEIGSTIQTEPGNKSNSAKTEIAGLVGQVISVPIVKQQTDKGNGRYDLEVRGFAILKVTSIGSDQEIYTELLSYQTASVYKVSNLAASEKFPAKVELAQIPSFFTKTGTLASGYTLSGNLSDITYTKVGTQYTAQPISYTLQVKPTENGIYVLNQSNVTYTDSNGTAINDQFNPVTLRAETRVTIIQVSPASKTLNVGEDFKLIATVTPDAATNKAINWSSSNPAVATVDGNGLVKGIAAGTVTITASSAENPSIKATSSITVKVPVTSITLNKNESNLQVDKTDSLIATIFPANATNKNVRWSSSDTSIVSVDANALTAIITAKKAGEAIITVTTEDGEKTATCHVVVEEVVEGVLISPSDQTINVKDTVQLTATVLPETVKNKDVTWASSNPDIASVSASGLVTGNAVGSVIITATSEDGSKSGRATITVRQPVTGVELEEESITLNQTDKKDQLLHATVLPADASNKDVTWSSSNSAVAIVDANGKVTAVGGGQATITVTTVDGGYTDSCQVIISTQPEIDVSVNDGKSSGGVSGWDAIYTEKAVVTVKVTYYPEAWPSSLEFGVNGTLLPRTAISDPVVTNLPDGRKQAAYTFDVNAVVKEGNTVKQVLLAGPVTITAKVIDRYQTESELVTNQLVFYPQTLFEVTTEREGSGKTETGKLTAEPTTTVMDDVKYAWLANPETGSITPESPWKDFNSGNVATQIPLNSTGSTPVAVAMMQDFNGNGNYLDKNEIAVQVVEIEEGIVKPEFEVNEKLKLGDSVVIAVTPNPDTINENTKWYYSDTTDGSWKPFELSNNDFGQFVADYQKATNGDLVDTLVKVKAVTPSSDGNPANAQETIETILLKADRPVVEVPGENPGNQTPDYGKVIQIQSNEGLTDLENRAKKVTILYKLPQVDGLSVTEAFYTVEGTKFNLLANGGNTFAQTVTKLIKTNSGNTKSFTVHVEISVKFVDKITNKLLEEKTFVEEKVITVKAKNTMN